MKNEKLIKILMQNSIEKKCTEYKSLSYIYPER